MKDNSDYVVIFAVVGILAIIALATVITERETNRQCREMISLARNRSDSLIVYGMKPYTQYMTCYDRLN